MSSLQDRTLVVKNFDPVKTTRDILKELCTQGGPVRNVVVKPDHAFVEFADAESVGYSKALLDGVVLYGKKLILEPKLRSAAHFKYTQILNDYIKFDKHRQQGLQQQQQMIAYYQQQQSMQQSQPFMMPLPYQQQQQQQPLPNFLPQPQFVDPIQPQMQPNFIQTTPNMDPQFFEHNPFAPPNNQFNGPPGQTNMPRNHDNNVRRSRSFNHHQQGRNNFNRHHNDGWRNKRR